MVISCIQSEVGRNLEVSTGVICFRGLFHSSSAKMISLQNVSAAGSCVIEICTNICDRVDGTQQCGFKRNEI